MQLENGDAFIRFLIFASVLSSMAVLEFLIPKRDLTTSKLKRWITNISITMISNGLVRLMGQISAPLVALSAAFYAQEQGWGLLHMVELPFWVACVISILFLDFAIYLQHVLSHKIPILWRLHKVHHADIDIDVTTAVRFHPVEIVLSMLFKVVLVFALGPPVFAVFLFEVILSSTAMFNHANIDLPRWLDRFLRLFLVTPDMHRVHHSVRNEETDSNFGFNAPWWDYLFGTYRSQPKDGHKGMTIGLEQYQTEKPRELVWSLLLPFRSNKVDASARNAKENISE